MILNVAQMKCLNDIIWKIPYGCRTVQLFLLWTWNEQIIILIIYWLMTNYNLILIIF